MLLLLIVLDNSTKNFVRFVKASVVKKNDYNQ